MALVWLVWLACSGVDPEPVVDAPVVVPDAGPPPPRLIEGPRPERVAARHILLSHPPGTGGPDAPYSQADYDTLLELRRQIIVDGVPFSKLAREYTSDIPGRAGYLGASDYDGWVPEFSDAVFSMEIGEISLPVRTDFGLHLIQRMPLDEVHLEHVVVMHADTDPGWSGGIDGTQRSPADAQARAQLAWSALDQGAPFSQVAADFSDGPMAQRGGDLGVMLRGELGPAFDTVAFALEPGQTSAVFETPVGFHILRRVD
jgi:hypothetical protein